MEAVEYRIYVTDIIYWFYITSYYENTQLIYILINYFLTR